MTPQLPYGIGSWHPVIRGGHAPRAYFDAAHTRTPARLREIWRTLPDGESVVLARPSSSTARVDMRTLERDLLANGVAERFAVFPGSDGRFTLLPAMDGSSLRGGMALLPGHLRGGRALWTKLRSLKPFGLPQDLGVPEIVIWTKGTAVREGSDLPVLPVAGSIAVSAGAAELNQKTVVRALDRRGAARAVLKIGHSERSDDAVSREARALVALAETLPHRAPRLLAEGERAGRIWLAQEVLDGRPTGDTFSPAHAEFLVDLCRVSRGEQALSETCTYLDARRNLTLLDHQFDPDWHAEYTDLMRALEHAAEGVSIPTTTAHGDFTPGNLVKRRGIVQAFDWEYYSERTPALHDLLHFVVTTSVVAKRRGGERIFDDFASLFAGAAGSVVRAAELTAPDVLRLMGLYILHDGTADEVQERLRPSTSQDASALRHARRAICRRVAGLLSARTLPDWLPGRPVHHTPEAFQPERSAA